MTFYINAVSIPNVSDYEHRCVGLFYFKNDYKCHGEGYCCGWYGSEYFDDVILVGYYVQTINGGSPYSSKGFPHSNNTVVDEYYDKILIGSNFWTTVLEAENAEQALLKFFNEDFDTENRLTPL